MYDYESNLSICFLTGLAVLVLRGEFALILYSFIISIYVFFCIVGKKYLDQKNLN